MSTSTKLKVHIRWMIRRDELEVLAIENANYNEPWLEEDFLRVLRQRNCIGMVAEDGDKVVGFIIYELHKSRIEIIRMSVDPAYTRLSIGRQMVEKIQAKLSPHRRTNVCMWLSEYETDAHLFLKACGFRAVEVRRGQPSEYKFISGFDCGLDNVLIADETEEDFNEDTE